MTPTSLAARFLSNAIPFGLAGSAYLWYLDGWRARRFRAAAAGTLGMGGLVGGYVWVLKRWDFLYQYEITHGLNRAFAKELPERDLDLAKDRVVILSDQHKGTRDDADDFWRAERAYCAALAHYYELGYHLVVLGDAEELWENIRPGRVIATHTGKGRALTLEAMFHQAGRYDRIFGNHDLNWRSARAVRRHLGKRGPFGKQLVVKEGLKLRVMDGRRPVGVLFLVHGHQGTADSEMITPISRVVVLVFGKLQRRFKRGWNTPANDAGLRNRHDRAMFEWARSKSREKVALVAGHTHRPVFRSSVPEIPTKGEIKKLRKKLERSRREKQPPAVLACQSAELEYQRARRRWKGEGGPPEPVVPPCYFNSGCCSFADGDVTGIEIDRGEIRLVRWPDDEGRPKPHQLGDAEARLVDVFEEIERYRPPA